MNYRLLLASSAAIIGRLPSAFNSHAIETVAVKGDNGPVRINKSDYDQAKHELHEADETHDEFGIRRNAGQSPVGMSAVSQVLHGGDGLIPCPQRNASANFIKSGDGDGTIVHNSNIPDANANGPKDAADIKFGVIDSGKGKKPFIVIDMNTGTRVTDIDGIDGNGYASNKEGWDAILALQNAAAGGEKPEGGTTA